MPFPQGTEVDDTLFLLNDVLGYEALYEFA